MHKYNKPDRDYLDNFERWELTSDVISSRLKKGRTKYLPMPNPDDSSQRNKLKYDNYLQRAVFYNFTRPTQTELIGAMFRVKPTLDVDVIDYIKNDIDGSGLSFEQQAKDAARELTQTGRGGFFVDYTATERARSKADEINNRNRPVAIFYDAMKILRCSTSVINSKRVLSKIVLAEFSDDAIMHDRERVIFLNDDNICQIDLYLYENGLQTDVVTQFPTDKNGKNLDYIPFQFVGALNNDETVDESILYDLAVINVAHYQSSADYEDFRYRLGTVQAVVTGLTAAEIKSNGGVLQFGGAAWVFGKDAKAELLQAQPNMVSFESMKHKEEQARAIGAKLKNPSQGNMTATESDRLSGSEEANIITIIDNLESAYRNVFDMMLDRVQSGSISLSFSREFVKSTLSSDELRVLSEMAFKRQIPDSVLFDRMRKSGYFSDELTNDDIRTMLDDGLIR